MIYFIKAKDKVKIGYATDPSKRISSIQTSNPYALEVLLIIDGNYDKVTCPPKVVPMFKLGYGKTIKESEYVKEAL